MNTEEQKFMGKMDIFISALTELVNKTNTTAANNIGASSTRLKLPESYDGTRDAVMIDRWIGAVERHMRFHDWNEIRTMQFATTLLSGDADTWYRAIEANTDEIPKSWLEFKRLLIEAFKPPNAKTLARERLRICVQTGTIQQYVNEFQNIKLSLPNLTEDEACDRFISGLADDQLVAKIHDVDEDELTLKMALNMALSYEAARRPRVLAPTPTATTHRYQVHTQQAPTNSGTSSFTPPIMVDDPMDLDAMQNHGVAFEGCYYCGKIGHIREDCYARLRDIKAMEQQRYNGLVRNYGGQQQQGCARGARGVRNGVRGRDRGRGRGGSYPGGRNQQQRRGVSFVNTVETSSDTTTGGGRLQQDQAYSTSVASPASAATALPYAHTEIPKMHSSSSCQLESMLPIELKPIIYENSASSDNGDCNTTSTLYQIDDAQHLLHLNQSSSLPVYASVAGQTRTMVHVLIDSGASDNYVSSDIVPLLHVDNTEGVYPPREVETADGNTTKIKQKVTFGLSINGEYRCQVTAYVFPTKFDLILGRTWLKEHSPRPVWETDSYWLGQEPHVVEIKPVSAVKKPPMSTLNYLITHKQADRELKHGGFGCLLYIKDVYERTSSKADTKEQQQWLDSLIKEFGTVFQDQLPGLPPNRKSQHVIKLEDENCKPANRAPFRMSPAELDELRKQLKELLDLGLIRPSSSPWGAPVLFVRKKDGKSLRMCIDYRALNKLTVKNRTYLPRIDECLDKMQGASYFTCLDLKSGYFQIRLQESDVPKTAFNSRYGKYEWLVLAQGLTNAPLSFQTQMNDILGDCLDKYALCYLDDVCIFSKTFEEHQKHVREVLDRFKKHQFVVNKAKCKFAQRKLVFLGYQVSEQGILPSPQKVAAVSSWPRPKNVQECSEIRF